MWKLTICHSLSKNSSCKALKAQSVLHGTTWPKILSFNVAVTWCYTVFLYISGCDSIQGTDFLGFSWLMKSMYGPTWHIFNGIFMTHEIEIIISHFSLPLKSLSVIFIAHEIYNTPTFHGSWTLVPDISWQFHEPWKPLSTFHRKFMAWKIGHENEISVFRALKNAFLGF